MVENQFCEFPELRPISDVILASPGSAGVCGAEELQVHMAGLSSSYNGSWHHCIVSSFLATSTQLCHVKEGGKEMPFTGGKLLLTLLCSTP